VSEWMSTSSKRSKFFDNAKFILIFLVVFGHVISPLKEHNEILFTLYTVIFLFHMPAFIFISGYFSKRFNKKGNLLKVSKKLLIPYLIFQFIYSIYYFLIGQEKSLVFDFLHPHWAMWFLISLYSWNMLLFIFSKLKWYGFVISLVVGAGIGYIDHIGSFLSLSRTFVFFPYFLLGYLLNGSQLKRIIRSRYSLPVGIAVIVAATIFFAFDFPYHAVPWLFGDSSYASMGGEHVTDGFFRLLQYGLTLIVVFAFLTLIPSRQFRLTQIGERTIYVYLLHGFVIKLIQAAIPNKNLDFISSNYLLLIIFSFVICLILGSYVIKKYTSPIVELNIGEGS
jgi:fucose 4-O-acetylase-like acetyltransferase